MQRGEGVVRDLRLRIGDARDQRGLAGVGQAQQAHVGQHLQFHAQVAVFAFLAGRPLARRAVQAGLEVDVAHAALAAGRQHDFLFVRVQVEQDFAGFGVMDDRAHRHAQGDVRSGRAVLVGAAAVLAALGAVQARVAEVDQRIDVAIGHRIDGAAASAVAAVRAALGDEFFAAKARHAIAAFAGDHFNGGFVYEFHGVCACSG
ncbi:hypothetical protein D3C72_1188070 [compost metagenome]